MNENKIMSLEGLYKAYAKDVYRFIYSRSGDKDNSEDILAETFITLNEVLDKYNGSSSIKTYIFGIALNKLRRHWQKHGYQSLSVDVVDAEEFEEFIDQDLDEKEILENKSEEKDIKFLNKIMGSLPQKYALVLSLRFLEGLSIKETSERLDISESNVTTIQNRALAKARKVITNISHNPSE